jgi:hypothetical protein
MCGAGGTCQNKGCSGSNRLEFCQANAECGAGNTCAPLGLCSLTPDFFCLNVGGVCGAGARGTPRGNTCVAPLFSCQTDICEAATYAMPAVEVATLPGSANALIASLDMHTPAGLTPTSGALSGAIAHAQALAKANPTHQEVVVMATDGFPSECVPLDIPTIAGIAAKGLAGPPSISTFVIGVFAPAEATEAQMNLNAIASAGGTKQAFVINLSQNVTQQFVAALNAIRTAALSCEFKVPTPAPGETLDYYSVNVQYTSGAGQAVTIGNVSSKAACSPTKGGWYYDVDPANGGTPQNISICDTTCTQLRGDAAGRVDVLLGCKTEIIVP